MHTIFLALGSNVGDKVSNLEQAILLLEKHVSDIKKAQLYQTKPVGYEQQDNFVNTAVAGQTDLTPEELFLFVKEIEKQVGRIERFRWGPREIDIDILFYDDLILKNETLQIPHPRLHERDFVVRPLMDLAPQLRHPILQQTIAELWNLFPLEKRSLLE
jgi:2-amino-4-hydroxy-6-hydroxymethyldihydropteridine diphosphokinase